MLGQAGRNADTTRRAVEGAGGGQHRIPNFLGIEAADRQRRPNFGRGLAGIGRSPIGMGQSDVPNELLEGVASTQPRRQVVEQFRAPGRATELSKIVGRLNDAAPEHLEPNSVGGGSPQERATRIGECGHQGPATTAHHRFLVTGTQQRQSRQRSGLAGAVSRTAKVD